MSTFSNIFTTLMCVRCTGRKDAQTGYPYNGTYIPGHINAKGQEVSARWTGYFHGNFGSGKENHTYLIVAWNSTRAFKENPGGGMADFFAKYIPQGKEITLYASHRPYTHTFRDRVTNEIITHSDGSPVTTEMISYHPEMLPLLGADSKTTLEREIKAYESNPQAGFHSRPRDWDVPGTPGNKAWQMIVNVRKSTVFHGQNVYGYAKVQLPPGYNSLMDKGIFRHPAPQGAASTQKYPYTYEALVKNGWTPEQIQQHYPGLKPAIPAAPATSQQTGFTYEVLIAKGFTDAEIRQRFPELAPTANATPPAQEPPIPTEPQTEGAAMMTGCRL